MENPEAARATLLQVYMKDCPEDSQPPKNTYPPNQHGDAVGNTGVPDINKITWRVVPSQRHPHRPSSTRAGPSPNAGTYEQDRPLFPAHASGHLPRTLPENSSFAACAETMRPLPTQTLMFELNLETDNVGSGLDLSQLSWVLAH